MKNNRLKILAWLSTTILIGCYYSADKPYLDFENKLKEQLCDCIAVFQTDEAGILEKYEKCQNEMRNILKDGLKNYEVDKNMSKEEYLGKLPETINRLKDECRFYKVK